MGTMAEDNEQLRYAREHTPSRRTPGACLGRQELAELVNEWVYTHRRQTTSLDKNYIGKLEKGRIRWPDEAYRAALRAVLGAASDVQLGFYDTRRMPAHTTTADRDRFLQAAAELGETKANHWPARKSGALAGEAEVGDLRAVEWPTMAPEQITEPEGDDTNRRQVLAGSALGLFGAAAEALAPLLDRPQSDVPTTVDPAVVDHFAALRAVLVNSDNRLGAAWVLPSVRQQLAMIALFRRQARGRLYDQLLSTESRWAEFAGWLSDDLGDRAAGAWWLGQAMSMAQEANDLDFLAFLFARMAQRTAGGDDEDRVLGLAHAAMRAGTTHQHVQAFAILQQAHGHAINGESRQFQSATDEARTLVEHLTAPADNLGSFCTTPYVLAQEGEGWLRLGRPKAAAQCFSDALTMWPASYQRDRGLYLSRAAAAHLASHQPDEAATMAIEALELADVTRSTRVGRQVIALSKQLASFGDRPTTARLLTALNESATVRP